MRKISIKNILFNILTIVTFIAVGFTVFNIAVGAKGYAVTSDSMKDTFARGDIVFSKEIDFDNLQVGDIVTVGVENSEGFFTHRVVEIDKQSRTVTTKGDNNNSVDPMPAKESQIVGKVWYSVPLLGYLSIYFSTLTGTTYLIVLVCIAVVLITANIILTKSKKRRVNSDEQN